MSVSVIGHGSYILVKETGGKEALVYKINEILEIYAGRYKAVRFQKAQIPFYKKRLDEFKKAQRNEVLEFSQGDTTIQFTKEEIPFLEECFKQLKGEAE
ncbi:hypothetical protein NRS6094_04345 [Bacillus subtilis]|uniref:hypothetical protein n=1 Tax=Bacillus subtilis TaxID=1423 RepID=UPI001BA2ECDB|nr:hypothetical protein [Bacillus subtilis]CAF1778238.1 hypothetical protein NRS6094_04345 [Bacillus subtilis]